MIRRQLIEITCDGCRATLDPRSTAGYGELVHHFGYGSPFDNAELLAGSKGQAQLCEECWRRACAAVGLDPRALRRPPTPPAPPVAASEPPPASSLVIPADQVAELEAVSSGVAEQIAEVTTLGIVGLRRLMYWAAVKAWKVGR